MTELIWEGKYDANGKRVAPLRLRLPFQTVETVNESAQERQMALDLFSAGRPTDWRNRLIWGDKKYVLPSLLDEFAGQVNLIYIDPPFNVGADFSFTTTIPASPDADDAPTPSFVKEPSILEQKAYRDTWGRGLDSYLQWFYETAMLLRELLTEDGSIYIHLDWHIGHYAKVILDEVFGTDNFMNQIIWHRTSAHSDSSTYGNAHDLIFFYARSAINFIWNKQYQQYDQKYIESHYRYVSDDGRQFRTDNLTAMGLHGKGYTYEWNGVTRVWRCPITKMQELETQGRIRYTRNGVAEYIRYLDEMPGVLLQDTWDDISPVNSQAVERVAYSTQKPEALLERILNASSNPGDLVLDCFCGSGTTPAVAEKLGRRWLACDLGRFAIHTTRKRLLALPGVKPFVVQNLGKYERQAWQKAEFANGESANGESVNGEARMANETAPSAIRHSPFAIQQAYRRFILELYHAQPIQGYAWLHGVKSGRMVHVGAVDAPVCPGDVTQIALEFRKAVGTGKDAPTVNGVDILGWDFAFELNEIAKQQATLANLNVRFVRIPREVLEKKAVEQGDIKFFELAALAVEVGQTGRGVTLRLSDFVIPPDDVPADVQAAITHWSQWIDYWAVDWDNHDDTFHNQWQTYRTRKDTALALSAAHTYEQPGAYRVMVKVIDILGNDTTKTLLVEVE